jgi:AcrR family transcriptional regulator
LARFPYSIEVTWTNNGSRAIPTKGAVLATRSSVRFDRKLEMILRHAATVFRAKGFDRASMRDIARETGVSLAGLYYYFSSKEELLYLIQRHAFETVLASSRSELKSFDDPEERLRAFIRVHLQFFLDHPNEMKVLTHEVRPLEDAWGRELSALKRSYYGLCFNQVEALKQSRKLKGLKTRLAVLSLFGMMNWIYQWYNPRVDPDARVCAEQMTAIFLDGIFGLWARQGTGAPHSRAIGASNGRRSNGRVMKMKTSLGLGP